MNESNTEDTTLIMYSLNNDVIMVLKTDALSNGPLKFRFVMQERVLY